MRAFAIALVAFLLAVRPSFSQDPPKAGRRPLPKAHPRLFGSAEQIQQLSKARPALWTAVLKAAETGAPPAAIRARTRGFASVVTGDPKFARAAIADALKIVAK